MNNENNGGCGCACCSTPSVPEAPVDILMGVGNKNPYILPTLQTYMTIVLRPNIFCNKNLLTQQMLGCESCKYVIRWDYDLNGETITVPQNCILTFDGGSLKNGTLVLNGCAVYPSYNDLEGTDLTIEGMPKAGTTMWYATGGVPLWSNGTNWVNASGNVINI